MTKNNNRNRNYTIMRNWCE